MAKKAQKTPENTGKIPHISQDIPGWCNFRDFYAEIAKWISDGGTWVELGVYWGQSFSYGLVECMNQGKKIDFVAVDAFPWTDEWGKTTLDRFLEHMAPLDGHFRYIKSGSDAAASQFADKSVDFVFIDANHEYQFVKDDINAWLPKIKPGGIIAGHDYNAEHPGVLQAVPEIFGDRVIPIPSDDNDGTDATPNFYSWKVQL